MKGLKYIAVLLLVNILILVGHNLVPHHHHLAALTHPSSTECPEAHECPETTHDHHDEDSGSECCHAFNDISFVKYNLAQLPQPEKLSSFLIIADPGTVSGISPGFTSTNRLILKLLIPTPELSGAHSLRGPPVLA